MKLIYRQRLKLLKNSILYSTITTMAKIVYDDGREETFNQEDLSLELIWRRIISLKKM